MQESKQNLSDYLKIESRKAHESIEKSFDLMGLISFHESYVPVLKAFYSYYRQVELLLKNFTDTFSRFGIDIESRLKLKLLEDDLHFFGVMNLEDLPRLEGKQLPVINNYHQAIGVLYVLEGSTLGGQVISKQLRKAKVLGLDGEGGRFLSGYGDKTHEMWTSFKFALNTLSGHNDDAVLNAAKQTFQTLELWLVQSRENVRNSL